MSSIKLEPLSGERQPGESNKAVQACNDFLRMGPGRSLVALRDGYIRIDQNQSPTRSRGTLLKWSMDYHWQDRAALYDRQLEERKNARAKEIMESGLALDHERVLELKHLFEFLKMQVYEMAAGETFPAVWLKDVKTVGYGKNAQRVDIVHFNAAIIDQLRGVLDDLAKETGGRVSKHEMSGPDGGPIAISDEQRDRAISTLAQALGNYISGGSAGGQDGLGTSE